MALELKWVYKKFDELTLSELYAILQLRIEVFSVEQECAYQDADGKDMAAWHLCGWEKDKLAAYCRLLPPNVSYDHPSIGRVVTSPEFRRSGYGRELMKIAIEKSVSQFRDPEIIISAQLYLKDFYNSFGFNQEGETYLEDGIPHIQMRFNAC